MTTDNKKNNGEWKQCRTELKAHIYMEEKTQLVNICRLNQSIFESTKIFSMLYANI